ncbi:hypothetical protein PGT21_004593 [Puccinia graminis f. sp. tritici]|uniref:Uncharacterized protein n=1 Tax=Puccinia graminis f. sp. tritici TaxID=56615 RepID=A0A5B0N4Z7_PUCGR|nr:hypothetical protein PGTUg99_036082 [Puccinia graminis f. sp. tritici]KAA1093962.1 hypothetical protein PGT21_004593 [Puccinia graminis f. sp. tritici]
MAFVGLDSGGTFLISWRLLRLALSTCRRDLIKRHIFPQALTPPSPTTLQGHLDICSPVVSTSILLAIIPNKIHFLIFTSPLTHPNSTPGFTSSPFHPSPCRASASKHIYFPCSARLLREQFLVKI